MDQEPVSAKRRRILIVVSSYDPAMAASMHRARMLAWHLKDVGWDVELLCPAAEFQQEVWIDPHHERFFDQTLPCHRAPPVQAFDWLFPMLRMRGAAWRGLLPMYRAGRRILREGRFDLVLFSTTIFNFFCLGRIWRRQFGVPYILDFQDPWFRPRGRDGRRDGSLRSRLAELTAKPMEAFAVAGALGLVSVSPNYLDELAARHPRSAAVTARRFVTIPFGARPDDLTAVQDLVAEMPAAGPGYRIGYVGVGSVIMQRSFRRLADGLARVRAVRPDLVDACHIQLAGTEGGWRAGHRKILWEHAEAAGIGDLVQESPAIVRYSAATAMAAASDGLLVLGVDDPAYMPSKLFPYAFTGKPLLACLHCRSQVNDYFARFPELGLVIHFGGRPDEEAAEDQKIIEFLQQVVARRRFGRETVKAKHSAEAMTCEMAEFFGRCMDG